MSDDRENEQEAEHAPGGPVVHDKRRIDPVTGAVRPWAARRDEPVPVAPPPDAAVRPEDVPAGSIGDSDQITLLQMELAERTSDLQRVQAEYLNYRRRVDRDREAVRDLAVAGVVSDLLPVLDGIGRADEHGELVGGFRSVADALSGVLTKLGVELYGEVGEPFDPLRHEALMHAYSDEVTQTTCIQVFQPGYRLRERVLRPARVAVADPTEALPVPPAELGAEPPAEPPAEPVRSTEQSTGPTTGTGEDSTT